MVRIVNYNNNNNAKKVRRDTGFQGFGTQNKFAGSKTYGWKPNSYKQRAQTTYTRPSSLNNNKPKKKTMGTTQGSLAHFMGKALGKQHSGRSSGLKKQENKISDNTRKYHMNKTANKGMAKAFSAMVMEAKIKGKGMARPSEILRRRTATHVEQPKWVHKVSKGPSSSQWKGIAKNKIKDDKKEEEA